MKSAPKGRGCLPLKTKYPPPLGEQLTGTAAARGDAPAIAAAAVPSRWRLFIAPHFVVSESDAAAAAVHLGSSPPGFAIATGGASPLLLCPEEPHARVEAGGGGDGECSGGAADLEKCRPLHATKRPLELFKKPKPLLIVGTANVVPEHVVTPCTRRLELQKIDRLALSGQLCKEKESVTGRYLSPESESEKLFFLFYHLFILWTCCKDLSSMMNSWDNELGWFLSAAVVVRPWRYHFLCLKTCHFSFCLGNDFPVSRKN